MLCLRLVILSLSHFHARKSILYRIHTVYIHHVLSKFANLKVHYSDIARKPHDIFTFLGVERESTSMYVMHTNENVIKKVEM